MDQLFLELPLFGAVFGNGSFSLAIPSLTNTWFYRLVTDQSRFNKERKFRLVPLPGAATGVLVLCCTKSSHVAM